MSTERNYSGSNANMLRGRGAPAIGPWEEYRICWPDSSEPYVNIYSQSAHMFVSAEYDYSGSRTGELRARANTPGPWETFRIYCIDNGYSVTILGHFWVSEENDYTGSSAGMLRARATEFPPFDGAVVTCRRSGPG